MILGSYLMDISKNFLLRFGIVFCLLSPPLLPGSTTKSNDQENSLLELRRRLDRIETGIISFKASFQNSTKLETSFLPTNSLKKVSASKLLKLNRKKKNTSGRKIYLSPSTKENKLQGFYILPFVGMQSSTDIGWSTFGGSVEINLKNGLSNGLRLGYNWYDLFAEFQFSYQRNDLKGTNPSFNIIGDIEGIGFYLTSGGRINFNEFFSGILGIGVGGIKQEFNLSWFGYPIGDTDFLFSSHVLFGIEFRPIDHLILGLSYRWILIDEMDQFSKRYLNSIELSAGYHF